MNPVKKRKKSRQKQGYSSKYRRRRKAKKAIAQKTRRNKDIAKRSTKVFTFLILFSFLSITLVSIPNSPIIQNASASLTENIKFDTNYTIAYYDFTSMTIGEINKVVSRYNPPTSDSYNDTSYGWWNTTISKDSEGLNITTHVHSNNTERIVLCPYMPYPKSTLELKYKWSSWEYNQLSFTTQTVSGSSTKRLPWEIYEVKSSATYDTIRFYPEGDGVAITRNNWHTLKIELKDIWNVNATIDQNELYDGVSYGDYDDTWYHFSAPQYFCVRMFDPNSSHSQNSYLNVEYIKQYTNRSLITPIIHKFAAIGFDPHNTSESNSWSHIDYLQDNGLKGTFFLDTGDDYDDPNIINLIENKGWELGWHGHTKWTDYTWNSFIENITDELDILKDCYGKYPIFHSCTGNGENITHAKYLWDNYEGISRNRGFQSDFAQDEWFTNPNYFPWLCRGANMSISWFAYAHGNSSTADYDMSEEDFQYLVDLLLENGYKIMPYADAYFMARNTIEATFTNIDFTTSKYSFKANTNSYDAYVDINDYCNLSDTNSIVFAVDSNKAITQFETSSPHSAAESFNMWVDTGQTYTIRKMTVVPASGSANITLNTFDLSKKDSYGETVVSFKADSTDGNNVKFIIYNLSPGKPYKIYRNGKLLEKTVADVSGKITFSNSLWSECDFSIRRCETATEQIISITNAFVYVVICVIILLPIIAIAEAVRRR